MNKILLTEFNTTGTECSKDGYFPGQNWTQAKIFLALIIHESGLGHKQNWEST